MMRIKLYLGSQSMEDYLNRKSQKGYTLKSINSFDLFVPLRLDAYSFAKDENKDRIYRVDSRKVSKIDFKEYRQVFLDDGWQMFMSNYVNDEYNQEHIFFSDDSLKKEIFSDDISFKQRNIENATSSLRKGIFLAMAILFINIIFPLQEVTVEQTVLGFILHNAYIIIAVTIIIISLIKYFKNSK